MLDYYGDFVRSIHEMRAPLNRLLRIDIKYEWTKQCQQAFDEVNKIPRLNLHFAQFDPTLEIKPAHDVSKYIVDC